ncbi:MAG: ribulose-phosphate 3-epimerase, partial [Candidatus Latescibacteria bacterium]|nr:ribulose-phosphate 3-epimerase [Candidatus Latescibacterota bacterium]
GDEIARAEEGGCDTFHVDIMDWHFVPNLAFGPNIVKTIRKMTDLPIDVHLMVDNPQVMIGSFADAGSDYITVHVEVVDDVPVILKEISEKGVHPGISLKPDTPVEAVFEYLDSVEILLVMTVFPGFGGQNFIEASYERIRKIVDRASEANPKLILSVDGGVNPDNASLLVNAGVNYLVVGTSVFKNHMAVENIRYLRKVVGR